VDRAKAEALAGAEFPEWRSGAGVAIPWLVRLTRGVWQAVPVAREAEPGVAKAGEWAELERHWLAAPGRPYWTMS